MTRKYYIGTLEFDTKKKCEEHTRSVIKSLGCCKINRDHPSYGFFSDLLKNHPECELKTGCGIDYFFIKPNPLRPSTFQTMIRRIDGTEVDFSWLYCCQFKLRTNDYDLTQAMRVSIRSQIIDYKNAVNKLICNLCKIEDADEYHIDHDSPSFKELKETFIKQTSHTIPTVFGELNSTLSLNIFNDTDNDFKNDWIEYHKSNCKLQVLCKKCNLCKR